MQEYVGNLRANLTNRLRILKSNPLSEECRITYVIGNESCDLDSAVSSVVLAYFLNTRQILQENLIIPIFNLKSESELQLRTEVFKCFRLQNLNPLDVPIISEIDFKYSNCEVILVDHHEFVSRVGDFVVEIIDHRPMSEDFDTANKKVTCVEVGSCATLIMEKIWELNPSFDQVQPLSLIRNAVIADTINFSQSAGKTHEKDIQVIEKIDQVLGLDPISRTAEFQMISEAKSDIDSLSTHQVLVKDMKNLKNGVLMSSMMKPCKSLILRENFEQDLTLFLEENSSEVSILMGVSTDGDPIERDLAICPKSGKLGQFLAQELKKKPELKLTEEETDVNAFYFKQNAPTYSRKQVLPMIKEMCQQFSSQ